MKLKDYRRLGRISIKSRKKSTRHTVTGICFGLIMLIPIVYFTLGFYLGLTGQLDETATASVFMVASRNVYDDGASVVDDTDYGGGMKLFAYGTGSALAADEAVRQTSAAEYYRLSGAENIYGGDTVLTATVDGAPHTYTQQEIVEGSSYGQKKSVNTFKIVNTAAGDCVFLDAEVKDLAKNGAKPLVYGDGFTGDGKSQVLVSEKFLYGFGIDRTDHAGLIGKTFSLSVSMPKGTQSAGARLYTLDSGDTAGEELYNQSAQIPFLTDFTVAGIIADEYYTLPSASYEADVVVTAASVYRSGFAEGDYLYDAPTVAFAEGGEDTEPTLTVRYGSGIAGTCEAAAADGRMALAFGALLPMMPALDYMSPIEYYNMSEADTVTIAPLGFKTDCGSYLAAKEYGEKLNGAYREIYPASADSPIGAVDMYANSVYSNFFLLATIGSYLMLVLYTFGGIIFFATMLNLYNSVNYSVQARRNYMGVMRAIGAKQRMIPRLYFFEILLIFGRAVPWVLVFSAGLSYLIKFGIDTMFRYMGEMFGSVITMPFAWYFVTLAGVVAVVFVIALAFSQIACKNVAGKPILEVLSDDKG